MIKVILNSGTSVGVYGKVEKNLVELYNREEFLKRFYYFLITIYDKDIEEEKEKIKENINREKNYIDKLERYRDKSFRPMGYLEGLIEGNFCAIPIYKSDIYAISIDNVKDIC